MSSKNSLRQEWLRARVVLAACALLAALSYPTSFPNKIIAQHGMRNVSEAGDMQCVSYCSTLRPGTPVMEVKWRLADRLLNETELRSEIQQQGLEVTVYSEGFERGLFATVPALKPKALFRARTRRDGLAPAVQVQNRKIPGLEKLSIIDVATRSTQPPQPLRLMPAIADTAEGEWITVRLEGLDPGMEYTYRVRGGQSVVTCQAVVCPVDEVPIPRKRANRKLKTQQ
jgi:hypothetical protein